MTEDNTPTPADHPMMIAWTAYIETPEYANTERWAIKPEHTQGSLWAAFTSGFLAAQPSAAPVREEGGPEWFTTDVVEVEYHDGNGETHMSPWEVDWGNVSRWRPQPTALTTREEAPAEAGENAIKAACVAWHQAKGENPFNVLYQGAWCGSFPHQTGPERWTFTVPAMKQAVEAYLRAQPQAREEAQPVGVIDGETVTLPSIAADGPHKPSEHRLWLARQLLDSRMDDDEALSVVAFSPAITDRNTTPPAPEAEKLRDAEDLLFYKLKDLILEQSEGKWDDATIVRDAHHFANHLRPLMSPALASSGDHAEPADKLASLVTTKA